MKHAHTWKRVWTLAATFFASEEGRERRRLEVYRCRCGEMGYPA